MSLTPGILSSPSSSGSAKPTLLCLHGGGTNAQIFNIQTVRLQRALSDAFDFIFIDAPFPDRPGPGVVPVFEGCGPFYRWLTSGTDAVPAETRTLVSSVLASKERDYVGTVGFSQGGALAAALCQEQQFAAAAAQSTADATNRRHGPVRFAVFLNATSPPLLSALGPEGKGGLIRIPSLHVVGSQDPWKEDGEKLWATYFDEPTAKKVDFDIGHRLPTSEEDTAVIAAEIRRLYRETLEQA